MRIFKTKHFHKWVKRTEIDDKDLLKATEEIFEGLIGANLGNNLFKKRVSVRGRGKRSGARLIIAYRVKDKLFFMFGFEKNAKDNISKDEHQSLAIVGNELLSATESEIKKLIKLGEILEIGGKL